MSSQAENWPTVFDSSTCVRKGECPVTQLQDRSTAIQNHTIYFEQHGTGPEKVVFIAGLNTTSFSWSDQVKYFANSNTYSILVFDNRGVGNSSAPRGPYTTTGMAEDVITLLDYIGWTEEIHVVGLSLGGMVAQELATRICTRTASLTLCVTKPGGLSWYGLTPWKGLSGVLRAMATSDIETRIPILQGMTFPTKWLDSVDPDDAEGRTIRERLNQYYKSRADITRPQTLLGSLSQMSAVTTHRVTEDRHRLIATTIPKILILTGDEDDLVNPENSKELARRMPEAELVIWKDTGHGLHLQWPKRFNELLERTFKEGRDRFDARNLQASSV